MKTNNNDNIIVRLLISPRWLILRHSILLGFIFLISAGFVWHLQEEGKLDSNFIKYGLLVLFIAIFLGGSYLNIYILTPRLLLKNKWESYFISLFGIVLFIIVTIFFVQTLLDKEDNSIKEINYFIIAVNILSSFFAIFFLFAGTTTLLLFKHWIQDIQETEELKSSTLQMELKLLENQINPHFLFNMLNNANIMVDEDPDLASKILVKLDDLLHYQINDSTREKVCLSADITFLTDFLELEKTRRDYFEYCILEEGDLENTEIPPLLFIPFVENAVKHNSDSEKLSYINILFRKENNKLIFTCDNSKPKNPVKRKDGGLGLTNIKQRLDLLYGKNYSLQQNETETTYTVHLTLSL